MIAGLSRTLSATASNRSAKFQTIGVLTSIGDNGRGCATERGTRGAARYRRGARCRARVVCQYTCQYTGGRPGVESTRPARVGPPGAFHVPEPWAPSGRRLPTGDHAAAVAEQALVDREPDPGALDLTRTRLAA